CRAFAAYFRRRWLSLGHERRRAWSGSPSERRDRLDRFTRSEGAGVALVGLPVAGRRKSDRGGEGDRQDLARLLAGGTSLGRGSKLRRQAVARLHRLAGGRSAGGRAPAGGGRRR